MSDMPWVRFFPSDWLGGTRSLSAAETGIYITLVATMYERGAPISFDHAKLARLCGASNSTFKAALSSLIQDGKIIETDAGLWNDRVAKEVVYRQEKSEVGFQAANARWSKKTNKNNVRSNASAMQSQSERNANQKPEPDIERDTNVSPKKTTPFDELAKVLDDDRARAVVDHRQRIRKPLTSQAAKLIAGKMGRCPDPNFAADTMVSNGWQGFEPEWMERNKGSPRTQPAGKPRNIAEASARIVAQMRESQNANPQPRPNGELFEPNVRLLAPPNG